MPKKPKVTQVSLQEIFDHWIACGLMKHRTFDSDMQKAVKARLKDYTIDDLKGWITTYSEIWKGEQYWYTHKWSLEDFMKRGFKKFREEFNPYQHFTSSPSRESGDFCTSSDSPSPAFTDRFTQWKKATLEERKELEAKWKAELN